MDGFSGESEFEVFWVEKALVVVVKGLGGVGTCKMAVG